MPDVIFPHLGIQIEELKSVMLSIFGMDLYWYGFIITLGVFAGYMTAITIAKRSNQKVDTYTDILIYGLISAIIGARLYYVIFSWDTYKNNLLEVFNLRGGGLAIYGGVIGAVIMASIYAKVKGLKFFNIADTAAPGLIIGQAVGRWGNFMNQEAFGGYTNSLFAMQLKVENVRHLPQSVMEKVVSVGGVDYIQVHPTFLYESLWNLGVYIILLAYWKKRKFEGEIFFMYLLLYGLGRVWIEGMRTDQLIIGQTGIAVSQLLSGILIIFSIGVILYKRKKSKNITI